MNIDMLMDILEIDKPEDFSFFEHFAELMENEADISYDGFASLIMQLDSKTLTELTEGYFEEILKTVPDDQIDFYTLFSTIGKTLAGLAANVENEEYKRVYPEELYRFRLWYLFESVVHAENRKVLTVSDVPVFDALILSRLAELGEGDYLFDFSDAMDYPLDEYIFPVSSFDNDEEAEDGFVDDDMAFDEDTNYDKNDLH